MTAPVNLFLWRSTMKKPPTRVSIDAMLLYLLSLGILTRPLVPVRSKVSAPPGGTALRRRRANHA